MAIKMGTKYKTIVIDPPWPIEKLRQQCSVMSKAKYRPSHDRNFEYSFMSIDQIKQLPIQQLSGDDCWLFLWTIQKYLPISFDMIHDWGFKYLCLITWNKRNGMKVAGFNYMSEFIVVGRKGKFPAFVRGIQIPTVMTINPTRHSEKPNEFYQLLEVCYDSPKLSLFERKPRVGFDIWGDEAPNCVDLSWAGLTCQH